MLFERYVLRLLEEREQVHLERDVLARLAAQNELMLYRHSGFWHSMKTLKDAEILQEAWQRRQPWKVWED